MLDHKSDGNHGAAVDDAMVGAPAASVVPCTKKERRKERKKERKKEGSKVRRNERKKETNERKKEKERQKGV